MTGVRITIEDAQASALLAKVGATLRNPSGMLKSMGEYLLQSTQDRFATEAAPDGTPWEPLQPDYAAAKKGPGILRESGALLRSVRYQVVGQSLMVGTDSIYGAIHQFGGEIKPKLPGGALVFFIGKRKIITKSVYIPARPWLGLSAADRQELLEIVQDEMELP